VCALGVVDCSLALKKVREYYDTLTKLPITSILDSLFAKDVITLDDKRMIETKPLEKNRMTYLLDNVIILGLEIDVPDSYQYFIKVLLGSDNRLHQAMAKKIGINIRMYVLSVCTLCL